MKIKFSQKKFKESELADTVRGLCKSIITPKYREGLLVKVFFYTNPAYRARWRGNYRNIYLHGLYDDEWNMKGIDSVITLKIGTEVPHDKLVYLIAHETGHHIIRSKERRGGEKAADKLAEKLIERLNRRGLRRWDTY